MKFLRTSFILGFKSILNKTLMLFVILTIAMAFCQAIVKITEQYFLQNEFHLNVALLNEDESQITKLLMNVLLKTEQMEENFKITLVEDKTEGEKLVQQNKVAACVTIPKNFIEDVISGKNTAPTIIISKSDPLQQQILSTLSQNLSELMKLTQSGVYTTLDYAWANNANDHAMVYDINLKYVEFILKSDDIFESTNIEYVEVLSLGNHYSLLIIMYLLLLSTALFYKELNFKSDYKLLTLIKTLKTSYQAFYFARVVALVFVYLVLMILTSIIMGMEFDIVFICSMINATVFFVLLQCLMFNIFNHYLWAVQTNFILHSIFLIVAGGIVPSGLLPQIISKFEVFSPTYYLKNLLSTGLIVYDFVIRDNSIVLISSIIMVGLLYFLNRNHIRECHNHEYI